MSTHGVMKAFNSQVDDWSIYVEWLQHYFIADDVMDAERKRSILLTRWNPNVQAVFFLYS